MDISLSQIFKKKESSALGIDIGSSSIKIVQLKKKGSRAVLETYGELALGPYGEVSVGQATKLSVDKIIRAMKDLLNEKEVKITTRNCGVAIPFHASLLSVITMPAVEERELEAMVPIEARKYIPVPISEVMLDWSVIPKSEIEEGKKEVSDELNKEKDGMETVDILLAAIHNNIISDYNQVISGAGLSATFFEIELFSCIRSILDEDIHSAMIMDMGAASTKLYIVDRGIIRNSHIVNRGSQDMTAALARIEDVPFDQAEVMKRSVGMVEGDTGRAVVEAVTTTAEFIFSEANRVLFSYQKEYNKNVDKVILIGGGSALRGWQNLAAKNFSIPVEAGNPFSKVEAPAFLEDILKQTGPEFAVSVGVALRKLSEM